MIEGGLDEAWPSEVLEAVKPFRQGCLIEHPPLFYAADLRHPTWRTSRLLAGALPDDELG